MIHLYLIRHGETVENTAHILQGHLEGQLSQQGIAQAYEIATVLSKKQFDIIISSDLQRAMRTAEIINQYHHLPIHSTPLLRERNWGELTGWKIHDIRIRPEEFPESVESPEQLQKRSRQFLQYLLDTYDGKNILAVGHGYFNRCILAEANHVTPHEIPRINNVEIREVLLSQDTLSKEYRSIQPDEISAN